MVKAFDRIVLNLFRSDRDTRTPEKRITVFRLLSVGLHVGRIARTGKLSPKLLVHVTREDVGRTFFKMHGFVHFEDSVAELHAIVEFGRDKGTHETSFLFGVVADADLSQVGTFCAQREHVLPGPVNTTQRGYEKVGRGENATPDQAKILAPFGGQTRTSQDCEVSDRKLVTSHRPRIQGDEINKLDFVLLALGQEEPEGLRPPTAQRLPQSEPQVGNWGKAARREVGGASLGTFQMFLIARDKFLYCLILFSQSAVHALFHHDDPMVRKGLTYLYQFFFLSLGHLAVSEMGGLARGLEFPRVTMFTI